MHPFYVNFELLRLAEFPSTKVAQRPGALGIGRTPISPVHLQVVEAQEELFAVLALVGSLSFVELLSVLHYIVFSQYSNATDFAVIFSDGETEAGVVKH